MKKSIRLKLSLWVVALMIALMFIGGAIGSFFLEDYYLNTKVTALVDVYDKISELMKSDEDLSNRDNTEMMDVYCETKGVTLLVLNPDRTIVYAYGADRLLDRRLNDILFEEIIGNDLQEERLLKQEENYRIDMVTDRGMNDIMHLEMSGTIENDRYFIMRVAVENVRESIGITNRFYGVLSVVMIIVVMIAILVVTSRYTKPLLELAEISKKMSALNFDVKYKGKHDDEIGILGDSMNEMSHELEKTISELKSANIELQKDIDEKIETDRMRTEFISNVSHELKTPIALIQGYAEGLKEGITDDPESMEFYCDVIVDEAAKMNQMVKNLLTLNQIEFGSEQVTMERFDINTLVRGVLNAQKIKAEQNDVIIEFQEQAPMYVWADEFQIEEVITNYVSNAFNHVKGNKVIKVQITEKDGIVRVSVYNTGDNIPENELEHIWEKFYKIDKARTREYGGNGIGLSIVKAIMDRMGRECGAINHNDGVEFWFELDSNI